MNNTSGRVISKNWIGDCLHEILGYSQTSLEQCVVKLAKNKQIREPDTIFDKLVDQMDFPSDHPKLREFSQKLYDTYQNQNEDA